MSNTVNKVTYNVETKVTNNPGLDKMLKEIEDLKKQIDSINNNPISPKTKTGSGGKGGIPETSKEFDLFGKSLDGLKGKMGSFIGEVPFIGETLAELGTVLGPTGIAIGATVAVLAGIGVAVYNVRKELEQFKDSFRGLESNELVLNKLATGFSAIHKSFGEVDIKEYTKAVNSLAVAYNTTATEAQKTVDNILLLTNGQADLDNITEYSPMLKQMQMTQEQYVALTASASKYGIYNDKAQDATKEFHLSISNLQAEQTQNLKKYGIDFSALQSKVKSGRMSELEALKEVSKATENLTDIQKTDVLSTIFKAPGEDATAMYFNVINEIDTETSKLLDNMDAKTRKRYEQNKKLAIAQNDATAPIVGLMSSISTIANDIEIAFWNMIRPITETVGAISPLLDIVWEMLGVVGDILSPFLLIGEILFDMWLPALKIIIDTIGIIWESLKFIVNGIIWLVEDASKFAYALLPEWLQEGMSTFWDGFTNGLSKSFENVVLIFDVILNGMKAVNDFLNGDLAESQRKFAENGKLLDYMSGKTDIDPRTIEKVQGIVGSGKTKEEGEINSKLSSSITKSTENVASASTSSVSSVVINLEALQKFMGNQILGDDDASRRILSDLNIGLTKILNNSNLIVNK